MAASSNSSLSGSSVSSGKFLRRAPHFSLPPFLQGATCLQSAWPSRPPRAPPTPPAAAAAVPERTPPRGLAMPLPAAGCPSGGAEGWGGTGTGEAQRGLGLPARRPAVSFCGAGTRGVPRLALSPEK